MRHWGKVLFVLMWTILSVEAPASWAQPHPDDEITKLAEDLYLFRHKFHQSIFLITTEGVIVTDPIAPEAAAWLKRELARLTDRPVRYVIYSHHHNDHISGGHVFADTARFVSH